MRRPTNRLPQRNRRRMLHLEPLERREMLSVTLGEGIGAGDDPVGGTPALSGEPSDVGDGTLQIGDLVESSSETGTIEDTTYTVAEIDAIATDFGSTDYHEEIFEEMELRTVWHKVRAIRDGIFSVRTSAMVYLASVDYQPPPASRVDLITEISVYEDAGDGTLRKLKEDTTAGAGRIDIDQAVGGRDYYIRFNVQGHCFFEFLNTVVVSDPDSGTVLAYDGPTVEVANFSAGYVGDGRLANKHKLRVQGVPYEFDMAQFDTFQLYGDFDRVYLTGGRGDDTLKTWSEGELPGEQKATLSGDWGSISVNGSPNELGVYGNQGNDTAILCNLDGVSFLRGTFFRRHGDSYLSGERFEHKVTGFEDIRVGEYSSLLDPQSQPPSDGATILPDPQSFRVFDEFGITAELDGSAEDDHLTTTVSEEVVPGWGPRLEVSLSGKLSSDGEDYSLVIHNAVEVEAHSRGGNDTAELRDSAGNDLLVTTPVYAGLSGNGYSVQTYDFASAVAYSINGGYDVAKFYDSTGDDLFVTAPLYASLSGDGFRNTARGFRWAYAYATAGGYDVAKHFDSTGDDFFYADPEHGAMYLPGEYYNSAKYFEAVHAYATAGGHDWAQLHGSAADDFFYADPVEGALWGDGFYNRAKFFEEIDGYGDGGEDRAELYDSAVDDVLQTGVDWAELTNLGLGSRRSVFGFDYVRAVGTTGKNSKVLWPSHKFILELEGPWREAGLL